MANDAFVGTIDFNRANDMWSLIVALIPVVPVSAVVSVSAVVATFFRIFELWASFSVRSYDEKGCDGDGSCDDDFFHRL